MWFKNITLFQLAQPFTMSLDELNQALLEDYSRSCGKLEKATFGWISPLGNHLENEHLVYEINGCFLIAARKEEKILPITVVREHVQERIQQIEKEQGRKVGAREKRNLVDEMTLTLLPRAFSKSDVTYAYIDTKNNWLIVDAASRAKAEDLTVLLRNSLGSLKIANPACAKRPAFTMTNWVLHDEIPSGFTVDDQCEMYDPDHEKKIIRCVNQNLLCKEIQAHLKAGMQISKLAMTWQDRVSFVFEQDLAIKRIRFLDLVQEQAEDLNPESPEEKLSVDFTIASAEFRELLPDLFSLFGGLVEDNLDAAVA